MNKDVKLFQLQSLLHVWLSKYENRSIENIRKNCNDLNVSYSLGLNNPIWSLFWPLVYNGVVDFVGRGYYALVEPLILDFDKHFFCVNFIPSIEYKATNAVGIYLTSARPKENGIKTIKTNALQILKQIPKLEEVVDDFPKTFQDESKLKYYNWRTRRGLAELENNGLVRFFSLPQEHYLRQLPDKRINPEAFAIAYCLSRVVNNELNGLYHQENKELSMPIFGMSFSIYRVLLLATMCSGNMPEVRNNNYVFKCISLKIVQELNRIFSNSISYE